MNFDYPQVLWALAFALPLIFFDVLKLAGKRKTMPPALYRRCAAASVFFGLFLVSMLIALASPRRGGGQAATVMRHAADAVIALDVSRSMNIQDAAAVINADKALTNSSLSGNAALSRLQRGLSLALGTVPELPEIRFAVAAGRSRGVLAVPLTTDSVSVINFLSAVDENFTGGRGTNLESLLDAAAGAFQDSSPARRYILLVSDGEALSGSFKAAVERCKQNNIAIVAIALGSDAGQPVPGQEQFTSSRDQRAMYMAADLSGGLYVDGNRSDAQGIITRFLRSPLSGAGAVNSKSRWFLFVIIAIVCYGASKLSILEINNGLVQKLHFPDKSGNGAGFSKW